MNQPTDPMRPLLALIALWCGAAATPFLLLLAAGNAMWLQGLTKPPEFLPVIHAFARLYVPIVWLPSLALLTIIALYSRQAFPELYNRVWAGLLAGALATFVLDTFRQLGVIHGWLPADTVEMFGKMILGPPAPELAWTTVGLGYHFLNGASFGAFLTLVFGRVHWGWALVWALVVELGMMTLPPMGPVFGLFGAKTGSPGLFLITLVAHIGFGIALGVLAQRWTTTTGWIGSLIRPESARRGSHDPA